MKRFLTYFVGVMFFLIVTSCLFKNATPSELFEENKKDWFSSGDATWDFDDNELVGIAKGGTGLIMTKKRYKDFILELEFKPDTTL